MLGHNLGHNPDPPRRQVIAYQRLNVEAAATFNAAATSLIYDKMLRGALSGRGARSRESIVNLVGTDVIGVREMFMLLGLMPWSIAGGVGGVTMVCFTLGWSSAAVGLVVNFGLVGLSSVLSRNLKQVEKKRTALSDRRMANLTQLVEGIKAVKFYAWEARRLPGRGRSRVPHGHSLPRPWSSSLQGVRGRGVTAR
jgi:hypothetical protein